MTEFLTSWALARPRISVRKSSRRSDQRRPPRATLREAQVHALEPGRVDEHLELRARRRQVGHPLGVQLEHQVRNGARSSTEVVRSQRRADQAQVGPQDAVLVEAGHAVECTGDLLGDRLAPLGFASLLGRVEPGLEQHDQQPRDRGVAPQHALDVVLAEGDVGLPEVLGVGAQHGDLAPGQLRVEHQRVEAVILDPAIPQGRQRTLDLLADALVGDQVALRRLARLRLPADGAGRSRRSRTARRRRTRTGARPPRRRPCAGAAGARRSA